MSYKLLPFRFTRIGTKELIVNEVGDFVFMPFGTVRRLLKGNIDVRSEVYKDLLSKYIVCDEYNGFLQDVIATRIRTKKSFLDGFTGLHIFVLTLRCNQKCIYCQATSKDCGCSCKDMEIKYLDDAIRLMLKSPNPHITMEFQGGESSLVPKLVEYAIVETERQNKEVGKDITYVMCSNIINFPEELLRLCVKYNVFVSTSLDGPEFIHDHNRGVSGSYMNFVASLTRIKERLGDDRISPLMTTSSLSLDFPIEIIDSYRSLGFHYIFLRPLNPYGRAKGIVDWNLYYDKYIDFYKKSLTYILSLNRSGECFVEGFTTMVMKKILTPFPVGFVDLQSPAGIINSVVVYNYDGYVYCSDESRMMAECGDYTFRLGRVSDKYEDVFYGRKSQELSKVWATEYIAGCSDCAYQQYCGADPVRNYSTQGDWYGHRPSSLYCKFHKAIFDYLFELIDKSGDEVLPIFRKWIYD
ncbi:MAG: His-Xaa-Ser system radical SAM maturase HxsB [Bacteroidaceae bacterium]|nr:His-Xaa-Ser system radical SAM maturase HxsB [Bacteroidaceae bacterium]